MNLARRTQPRPLDLLGSVRVAMRRYISPILVESVIQSSLSRLPEGVLTHERLELVVEEAMVGLRLFVDHQHLPELMVELTEILTGTAHVEPARSHSSIRNRTGR